MTIQDVPPGDTAGLLMVKRDRTAFYARLEAAAAQDEWGKVFRQQTFSQKPRQGRIPCL
ncbi:MAG: hypothetical protein V2B19_32975 [Pseudomonadota bacterium]